MNDKDSRILVSLTGKFSKRHAAIYSTLNFITISSNARIIFSKFIYVTMTKRDRIIDNHGEPRFFLGEIRNCFKMQSNPTSRDNARSRPSLHGRTFNGQVSDLAWEWTPATRENGEVRFVNTCTYLANPTAGCREQGGRREEEGERRRALRRSVVHRLWIRPSGEEKQTLMTEGEGTGRRRG